VNDYEMMTIIHPRLNADESAAAVAAVEEQIVANGGEMLGTDVWGRRRLAYPIDGVSDGTYVLLTFNMPPQNTAALERGLRISESVLRHMLIRGIIPFEGGRDDRDDRFDRDDRDRDDDRARERGRDGSEEQRPAPSAPAPEAEAAAPATAVATAPATEAPAETEAAAPVAQEASEAPVATAEPSAEVAEPSGETDESGDGESQG